MFMMFVFLFLLRAAAQPSGRGLLAEDEARYVTEVFAVMFGPGFYAPVGCYTPRDCIVFSEGFSSDTVNCMFQCESTRGPLGAITEDFSGQVVVFSLARWARATQPGVVWASRRRGVQVTVLLAALSKFPFLRNVNLQELEEDPFLVGPLPPSIPAGWTFLAIVKQELTGGVPATLLGPHMTHFGVPLNNLTGPFPRDALERARGSGAVASNMTSIDLSGNFFSGPLPDDLFSWFPRLLQFAVSRNRLRGPLPSSLAVLSPGVTVDLSHNEFEGAIPPDILSGAPLTEAEISDFMAIDLSFNDLTGTVPRRLLRFDDDRLSFINLGGNRLYGDLNGVQCPEAAQSVDSCFLAETTASGGLPTLYPERLFAARRDPAPNLNQNRFCCSPAVESCCHTRCEPIGSSVCLSQPPLIADENNNGGPASPSTDTGDDANVGSENSIIFIVVGVGAGFLVLLMVVVIICGCILLRRRRRRASGGRRLARPATMRRGTAGGSAAPTGRRSRTGTGTRRSRHVGGANGVPPSTPVQPQRRVAVAAYDYAPGPLPYSNDGLTQQQLCCDRCPERFDNAEQLRFHQEWHGAGLSAAPLVVSARTYEDPVTYATKSSSAFNHSVEPCSSNSIPYNELDRSEFSKFQKN